MTDHKQVAIGDVSVGQEVCVWALDADGDRTWGQGGRVTETHPELVLTVPGVAEHRYPRSKFDSEMMIEVEVSTDPTECVNFGPDCSGEVEYFEPSGRIPRLDGEPSPRRCGYHRSVRAAQYAGSIEQYANSDVPPSWFDPLAAGEVWGDEG